jgi:cell division protein FtsL
MKIFVLLIAIAVASALGVVYMKHRTRLLFSEIQKLQQMNEAYDEALAQLQFEQNRWGDRERIEKEARDRLGMVFPDASAVISIKP